MNLLGPADMREVFELTDALGLHREAVRVELEKRGEGRWEVRDAILHITLPGSTPVATWWPTQRTALEASAAVQSLRRAD